MHKCDDQSRRTCAPRRGIALACALALALHTIACAAEQPGKGLPGEDDLLVTESAVPLVALKGGLGALALPLFGAAMVAGGVVLVYFAWSGQEAKRAFAKEVEYTTLLIDTAQRLPSGSEHADVLATWEVAAARLKAGSERAKTDRLHFNQALNASLNERLARLADPPLNGYEVDALNQVRMQQRIVGRLAPAFDPAWEALVQDRWIYSGMSDEREKAHLWLALASQGSDGALDPLRLGETLAYYLGISTSQENGGSRHVSLDRPRQPTSEEPQTDPTGAGAGDEGWNQLKSGICQNIRHYSFVQLQQLARQYIANGLNIKPDALMEALGRAIKKNNLERFDAAKELLEARMNSISKSVKFEQIFSQTAQAIGKSRWKKAVGRTTLQTLLMTRTDLPNFSEANLFKPRNKLEWLKQIFAVWCDEPDAADFPDVEGLRE